MTREEHLVWAKKRALEYLDKNDLNQAFTSLASDLMKHPETKLPDNAILWQLGFLHLMQKDAVNLRRWIEGFN